MTTPNPTTPSRRYRLGGTYTMVESDGGAIRVLYRGRLVVEFGDQWMELPPDVPHTQTTVRKIRAAAQIFRLPFTACLSAGVLYLLRRDGTRSWPHQPGQALFVEV